MCGAKNKYTASGRVWVYSDFNLSMVMREKGDGSSWMSSSKEWHVAVENKRILLGLWLICHLHNQEQRTVLEYSLPNNFYLCYQKQWNIDSMLPEHVPFYPLAELLISELIRKQWRKVSRKRNKESGLISKLNNQLGKKENWQSCIEGSMIPSSLLWQQYVSWQERPLNTMDKPNHFSKAPI